MRYTDKTPAKLLVDDVEAAFKRDFPSYKGCDGVRWARAHIEASPSLTQGQLLAIVQQDLDSGVFQQVWLIDIMRRAPAAMYDEFRLGMIERMSPKMASRFVQTTDVQPIGEEKLVLRALCRNHRTACGNVRSSNLERLK